MKKKSKKSRKDNKLETSGKISIWVDLRRFIHQRKMKKILTKNI